jgi:hypothetical protein
MNTSAGAFEVLHGTLVLLGRRTCGERAEVFPFPVAIRLA